MSPKPDKEALKLLRQERKVYIDRARGAVKEQTKITKAIQDQLAAGPATVPDLARALRMNTAEVLRFVSALRKYGKVVEGAKNGDYFQYQMAE